MGTAEEGIEKHEANLRSELSNAQAALTQAASTESTPTGAGDHAQQAIGRVVEAAVSKGKGEIDRLMTTAQEGVEKSEAELQGGLDSAKRALAKNLEIPVESK